MNYPSLGSGPALGGQGWGLCPPSCQLLAQLMARAVSGPPTQLPLPGSLLAFVTVPPWGPRLGLSGGGPQPAPCFLVALEVCRLPCPSIHLCSGLVRGRQEIWDLASREVDRPGLGRGHWHQRGGEGGLWKLPHPPVSPQGPGPDVVRLVGGPAVALPSSLPSYGCVN